MTTTHNNFYPSRMALIALCSLALAISAAETARADSPYERTMDLSLPPVARIQAHLEQVAFDLRNNPPASLSTEQRKARQACLDNLSAYSRAGRFPKNHIAPRLTPIFIDNAGTHCAVGELMRLSGAADLAADIATQSNLAYLPELAGRTDVARWAQRVGLTLNECARIQPSYCQYGPVADIQTVSVGPEIRVSWTNQDNYNTIFVYINPVSDAYDVTLLQLDGGSTSVDIPGFDWDEYSLLIAVSCGIGSFPDDEVGPIVFLHEPAVYRRGDANGDGTVSVFDGTHILEWLFTGGSGIACEASADLNQDSKLSLVDAIFLFNHLFLGGTPPAAPFPDCGIDGTAAFSCSELCP